jgi:hypothetical protein
VASWTGPNISGVSSTLVSQSGQGPTSTRDALPSVVSGPTFAGTASDPLTDGPDLRLRCVLEPDRALKDLLDRLGIRLPKRLQLPVGVAPM